MPNRAVNQFPTTTRETGDLFYIVRAGTDRSLEQSAMFPQVEVQYTNLTSAQILDLHDTPITVVTNNDATKIIVPHMIILRFSGGSAEYATGTTMRIGYESIISDTVYIATSNIANRSQTPYKVSLVGGTLVEGDNLVAYVATTNPTAGDSDILVETYYQLIDG